MLLIYETINEITLVNQTLSVNQMSRIENYFRIVSFPTLSVQAGVEVKVTAKKFEMKPTVNWR